VALCTIASALPFLMPHILDFEAPVFIWLYELSLFSLTG